MYDLHTHTLLSDGEMLPIELIRRASVLGYTTLAIADHVDHSNLSEVIAAQQEVKEMAGEYGLAFLCGVEITHVPRPASPLLPGGPRRRGPRWWWSTGRRWWSPWPRGRTTRPASATTWTCWPTLA